MKMRRQTVFLFALFGAGNLVLCNEVAYCPEGKFLPVDGAECRDCSRCPDNQIVRETCWQRRDTVCGTFTEFQPFYRENDLDILHNDNTVNDLNVVTHQETDANVTSFWQTASFIMIVLLSITTVICAVLIGTVCYRCRRDKKDGLMIYVEKDSMSGFRSFTRTVSVLLQSARMYRIHAVYSTESPAPGCSDAASRHSASTDDVITSVPRYSPCPQPGASADESVEKHSKPQPVHHFEITEEKPNT